jgi:hypothetical protein
MTEATSVTRRGKRLAWKAGYPDVNEREIRTPKLMQVTESSAAMGKVVHLNGIGVVVERQCATPTCGV